MIPLWILIVLITGIFSSCSKKIPCDAYKSSAHHIKDPRKSKKKRKDSGLFQADVSGYFRLKERHVSDRKAKRLLKRDTKKTEKE
jgi:hypothetical protein